MSRRGRLRSLQAKGCFFRSTSLALAPGQLRSHACFTQFTAPAGSSPIASGIVNHILCNMSRVVYHKTPPAQAFNVVSNVCKPFPLDTDMFAPEVRPQMDAESDGLGGGDGSNGSIRAWITLLPLCLFADFNACSVRFCLLRHSSSGRF